MSAIRLVSVYSGFIPGISSVEDRHLAPVIAVRRLTESWDTWLTIYEDIALKTRRKVFTVNIRIPEEGELKDIGDMDYYNDSLNNFMEERNISRAVLIGHSSAAYIVLPLTLQKPEKVEKLIIADIQPRDPCQVLSKVIYEFVSLMTASFLLISAGADEDTAKEAIRDFLFSEVTEQPEKVEKMIDADFWSWDPCQVLSKVIDELISLMKESLLSIPTGADEDTAIKAIRDYLFSQVTDPERVVNLIVADIRPRDPCQVLSKMIYEFVSVMKASLSLIPAGADEDTAKNAIENYLFSKMPEFKEFLSGLLETDVLLICENGVYKWHEIIDTIQETFDVSDNQNPIVSGFERQILFLNGEESDIKLNKDKDIILKFFPNARLYDIESTTRTMPKDVVQQMNHKMHEEFLQEVVKFLNE